MKAVVISRRAVVLAATLLAAGVAACSDPNVPDRASGPGGVTPVVHPAGWATAGSPDFHGSYLAAKNYATAECRPCHGNDYAGGLVGVSCRDCHASFPHPAGFAGGGSAAHAHYMRQMNYPLAQCRACHGSDYAAVKNDIACRTCHTSAAGPEACNTCHGNFTGDAADLRNAAPPAGLDGETLPTQPPVGVHQGHLRYFAAGRPAAETCAECHHVPAAVSSPGHLDATPEEPRSRADVIFADSLASLPTESGARRPAPVYDPGNHSCSGAYCHGNWGLLKSNAVYPFEFTGDRIVGNSAAPVWTDPSSAACGTCHGLPPTGHEHEDITECGTCHDGVVNAAGAIIDSTLHINGKINIFGEEYPMGR